MKPKKLPMGGSSTPLRIFRRGNGHPLMDALVPGVRFINEAATARHLIRRVAAHHRQVLWIRGRLFECPVIPIIL